MKTNEQRINNIVGQLNAFKKNINSSDYDCYQKIIQLKAIRSALLSLSEKVIKEEFESCFSSDFKKNQKNKLDLLLKEIIKK